MSCRGVEELLAERGIDINYETVRRWDLMGGVTFDDKIDGLLHLPNTTGHGAKIDVSTLNPENSIQI